MSDKIICKFVWNAQTDIRQRIKDRADSILERGYIPVFIWNLENRLFASYVQSIDPDEDDSIAYHYIIRPFAYCDFCLYLALLSESGIEPDAIEFLDY